jgi:hypothetical protein
MAYQLFTNALRTNPAESTGKGKLYSREPGRELRYWKTQLSHPDDAEQMVDTRVHSSVRRYYEQFCDISELKLVSLQDAVF